MKTASVVLISIVAAAALVSSALCHSGPVPNDCCFVYYPRKVNKQLITSYYETDKQCAKRGVILVTRKSYRICVDPSTSWVQKIMKKLDESNF